MRYGFSPRFSYSSPISSTFGGVGFSSATWLRISSEIFRQPAADFSHSALPAPLEISGSRSLPDCSLRTGCQACWRFHLSKSHPPLGQYQRNDTRWSPVFVGSVATDNGY